MAAVGGVVEAKGVENSLEIDSLAQFAIEEHNKKQNSLLEFVKVISVKEQLVSGIIYYITLEAKDGGAKKIYEATVLVKAWENFKALHDFVPVVVGGAEEAKGVENSLEIESLAQFAIEENNKKQNSLLEFAKVISAKEQLVSGTIYYITLEAKDGGAKKIYEAKVWVKAWENFKELQAFVPIDVTTSS